VRAAWRLLRDAVVAFGDDGAASLGAALAFYTIFSLAPLLLIVVSVAGLVFGEQAARGELLAQVSALVGAEGARTVGALLAQANPHTDGRWGTAVGLAVMLAGATTVFAALQDALDRIWHAPAAQHGSVWRFLRARLLSLGLVLGIGFLLIVSLVVSAALAALGRWWGPRFEAVALIADLLNFVLSFVALAVLFAMIYKWMPRVKVAWRDVWLGAALTAWLFAVAKSLIGFYIGRSGITSAFGAAASVVVLLLWVYYSAQIFLLGAELTWVYARRHGSLREAARPAAA
jgi:membrane protein